MQWSRPFLNLSWPDAITLSGHGHPERLEASQNVVQDRVRLQDCKASNSLCQRGEQGQHFDAGQVHPDTGVRTGAETEMIARPSADVETVRIAVLALVTVATP